MDEETTCWQELTQTRVISGGTILAIFQPHPKVTSLSGCEGGYNVYIIDGTLRCLMHW